MDAVAPFGTGMRARLIAGAIGLWLALAWIGPAQASSRALHISPQARIELLSARAEIAPGERFWVGLRQVLAPGWHTYWENPGDSGLPATLTWRLPSGAIAGPTLWPVPTRQTFGGLMNYGHAGDVILLTELVAPTELAPGDRFAIGLAAQWLVCAEICIPEEASFALDVPVGRSVDAPAAPRLMTAVAALPPPAPWPARFARDGDRLLLHLEMAGIPLDRIGDAYFFPRTPALLDHAAPQAFTTATGALILALPLAGTAPALPDRLEGVLVLRGSGAMAGPGTGAGAGTRDAPWPGDGFTVAAGHGAVAAPPGWRAPPPGTPALTLWEALLFAMLGGAILNLMPCVFPILSMKALALLDLPAEDRAARRRDGVFYGVGVFASFAAIAALLAALRAGGAELGWGFQLQSPVFVAVMANVMLAVGLNLSGVFAVRMPALATPRVAQRGGRLAACLTGALAVVVATPCTAPFMGAALGLALTAPPWTMGAVILALGIGFAAPVLILTLLPASGRYLPRPGPWLIQFRALLAFPVYATAAWLIWVLSQQTDPAGFALALGSLVAAGLAAWATGLGSAGPRLWPWILAVTAAIASISLAVGIAKLPETRSSGGAETATLATDAISFTPARLAGLRAEGRPVFVNMTAAWCITCLVNEANVLAAPAIRNALAAGGVVMLKGDWTRGDPDITAYLRSHGRSGVPLYVFYPSGSGAPEILPQILTESLLRNVLAR
jgi:DsbC/DsbD-like thiol-disulfide interchange protein/cytochrome c biogenesis protein CcdA